LDFISTSAAGLRVPGTGQHGISGYRAMRTLKTADAT